MTKLKISKISFLFLLILAAAVFSGCERLNGLRTSIRQQAADTYGNVSRRVEEAGNQIEQTRQSIEDKVQDVQNAAREIREASEQVDEAFNAVRQVTGSGAGTSSQTGSSQTQ